MAEEKPSKEEVKKKSPLLKWVIPGVLVLAMAGGGYLGWDLLLKGKKQGAEASVEEKAKSVEETRVIHPMESFIVNLRDKTGLGKRYLKVKMELEVENDQVGAKVKKHTPQLRDAFLLMLSNQTFGDVNTMEGKLELKQALLQRANQVLGQGSVFSVYFSEFVVQ